MCVQSLYSFAHHLGLCFALRLLFLVALQASLSFTLQAMAVALEIIPFSNSLDMYGDPDRK